MFKPCFEPWNVLNDTNPHEPHSSANFYFLYYPFTFLLPSLLTSGFGQPPATSCHDMPRLEGSNPHLHHKQGWISIKWRGLTPPCTITLLLRGREQRNWSSRGQNQHSEAISALTLLQSSTSSTILSQSFTSLLLIATIILYFLVWATSCHILPHLATTCHDWALAGRWVSIKWRGLTPTCTITLLLCGREQRNWSSRGHNQHSEAISALTLLQSSAFSAILSHLCYHPS